jgi:type II secretory pathway pseudopilin PulG
MTATELPGKKRKLKWWDVFVLMLVVAFCAALTFFGLSSVVIVDKRSPTVNAIVQIQTAIEAYDTEYSEMPDASNNAHLIKVLSGDNPRKIEFISIKSSELSPDGQVLDEWGTPLRIYIDVYTKIHVTSAGRDQIFGTPDDITNH